MNAAICRSTAVSAVIVVCGLALGQQPDAVPTQNVPPVPTEFQVFRLKNIPAHEAAAILNNLFANSRPTVRVAADTGTNSLIVQARKSTLTEIEGVLSRLDTPRTETTNASRTRVIQLGAADPDKNLEDMIRVVAVAAKQPAKFVVDRNRRVVVVNGEDATIQAIEGLLKSLQPAVKQQDEKFGDVQIRVVWLVSGGAGREDAAAPPSDLKDVVAGLSQLGIERPRLAAQALVNVSSGSEFQASGTARLDNASCQFSVMGRFTDRKDAAGLQISIRAHRPSNRGVDDLGHIQTDISAPIGHMVVLGVTPTESLTSIFVVQVLRQDRAK